MEFGIAQELKLEQNSEESAKTTIKLTPINAIGLDGRKFKIEPDYVIFNSQKYSQILIRLEHGENRDALDKAVGWIDSLRVENDFIVGNVEFTEWGKTLINNKEYRYLSPEFLIDDMVDGFYVVNAIAGIGLVNRPNFKTLALNNQKDNQNKMDEKEKETKIKALELELEQIKKENNSLKIKNLIADGKILQSQESFALSLNAQQLDIFVQNNFEVMSNLTRLKGLTTVTVNKNETGKKELNGIRPEIMNIVFGGK